MRPSSWSLPRNNAQRSRSFCAELQDVLFTGSPHGLPVILCEAVTRTHKDSPNTMMSLNAVCDIYCPAVNAPMNTL
jgi:hypothetical protein